MAISRDSLLKRTDEFLNSARISDYCPNGLQVEGRAQIKKVVSGVTASQELIERAIAEHADLLLVHHGYFWKGEDPRVIGMKQRRLKALLIHDINLVGYHLPLDIHPEVGNNVQLAQRLGITIDAGLEPDNPNSVGLVGHFPQALSTAQLSARISEQLQREPLVIDTQRPIQRIGWCTGSAQTYIEKALAQGCDAYITGEVSEPTVHFARENNITFFAAGHHATERYGVQALGQWMSQEFDLEHVFIDCDNPV